jgi:dTMP kinase
MSNLFITFEGIDGSGKDTQLINLLKFLKEEDKFLNFWITKEPTNISKEGKEISKLLVEKKQIVKKEITTKLYINDRIKHSKIIKKQLKQNYVLCSRYDLSTLIYQQVQGMTFEELYKKHNYNKLINGCLIPDITFVFIVKPEISLKRIDKRAGKKEFFEKESFQKKLFEIQNKTIEKLEKKDNRLIIKIDANKSIEEVEKEMISKFKKLNF